MFLEGIRGMSLFLFAVRDLRSFPTLPFSESAPIGSDRGTILAIGKCGSWRDVAWFFC